MRDEMSFVVVMVLVYLEFQKFLRDCHTLIQRTRSLKRIITESIQNSIVAAWPGPLRSLAILKLSSQRVDT